MRKIPRFYIGYFTFYILHLIFNPLLSKFAHDFTRRRRLHQQRHW